jgi:Queuine tRNA-ribosyltransferases, contain PUA domain
MFLQGIITNMNGVLKPEVRSRVIELDNDRANTWGADIKDNTPTVSPVVNTEKYRNRTTVGSAQEGIEAFEKYTEYFDYILSNWSPSSDKLVMVPCGSKKPIGSSSIHQKKIKAIRNAEYLKDADLVIMSEPCTVIPHEMRLSLPAVNYDFPPEYTEETKAEKVFNIFVRRLADWLEECNYDEIYPYLVSRHMNKFDAAVEMSDVSPDVYKIPGASYNADTDSYSGDLFKSQDDVNEKVLAVVALKSGKSPQAKTSDECIDFYRNRFSD